MQDALQHRNATAKTGMIFFLGSWWMMFAGLLFVFLMLRSRQMVWPPAGLTPLPTGALLFSSVAVIASSALLELGRRRSPRLWLAASSAMAVVFLVSQVNVGRAALAAGFDVSSSPTAGFMGLIGAFHLLHAAVGAVALLVLALLRSPRALTIGLWANYWHFVGAIWFLIYVLVFPF